MKTLTINPARTIAYCLIAALVVVVGFGAVHLKSLTDYNDRWIQSAHAAEATLCETIEGDPRLTPRVYGDTPVAATFTPCDEVTVEDIATRPIRINR